MDIGPLVQVMAALLITMLVGFVAKRLNVINDEMPSQLSKLTVNVCMPALVLYSVMGDSRPSPSQMGSFILAAFAVHALLFALGLLTAPILRVHKIDRGTFYYVVLFVNSGMIGIPVLTAVMGEGAIIYSALYAIPFNLLAFTFGITLLTGEAPKRDRATFLRVFNPALIATFIAIAMIFFDITSPAWIVQSASMLGQATIPLSMLIIGFSLAGLTWSQIKEELSALTLLPVSLILSPLLVFWVLTLCGVSQTTIMAVTLLSACPVGTVGPMLAYQYGGNAQYASVAVFSTTLLSIVSIPFVAFLLFA